MNPWFAVPDVQSFTTLVTSILFHPSFTLKVVRCLDEGGFEALMSSGVHVGASLPSLLASGEVEVISLSSISSGKGSSFEYLST